MTQLSLLFHRSVTQQLVLSPLQQESLNRIENLKMKNDPLSVSASSQVDSQAPSDGQSMAARRRGGGKSSSSGRRQRLNETRNHLLSRNDGSLVSLIESGVPRKLDWRERGVISPVIYQGKCGACWAYSSLETIESMAVINNVTSDIPRLSAQQLIDCGTSASPNALNGCDGGDTCAVLSWLKGKSVRIVSESEYPRRSNAGPCLMQSPDHGILVNSYECNNFVGKEDEMIRLLASHGPLTATVDASSWPYYLGGVIKYNCESGKTHAIQIVGYNLDTETPYYIVKNSWGTSFGLDGYLHIAIGNNLCGIAEDVSSIHVSA